MVCDTQRSRSGFKLGVHPKTIQVRLGHTSIRTTMDIYGHLYEGVDEAAAQALDSLL
jgi:integrase